MLNKKPLFINAFARGGSNILMNLLMSHPGVCVSNGETHKVFKGQRIYEYADLDMDEVRKVRI